MSPIAFRLSMVLAAAAYAVLAQGQTLPTAPIPIPTGQAITPTPAPHSVYQTLNPDVRDLPNPGWTYKSIFPEILRENRDALLAKYDIR